MQGRMKLHQLTTEQIDALLDRARVGRVSTLNEDGFPYTAPVHYVRFEGKLYIHGLCVGQKISNLRRDPRVCFEVDEMRGILIDEEPCECNTDYESAIILGEAVMVGDPARKTVILNEIVRKYVPQLAGKPFPEKMVKATGVIEITPREVTGKYYK